LRFQFYVLAFTFYNSDMVSQKIPRRFFLKGLGAALLLSGCTSEQISLPQPTSTLLPGFTPTPVPEAKADIVAQAYLIAWSIGDYATMYNLLTPDSRIRLKNKDKLQNYYLDALTKATVMQVQPRLKSLLYNGNESLAGFHITWQTHLFGSLEIDNQMRLKFIGHQWAVEWQPTLILPQLGEEVNLAYLGEQAGRGNIYDHNGHALAAQGQIIIVGVIPQYLENEAVAIKHLAAVTGANPEKIKTDIAKAKADWFVPVAEVNFETSMKYDALFNSIPGVERHAQQARTYNDGEVAAHLIGIMGAIPADQMAQYKANGYQGDEIVGLMGLENWGEKYLAGQRGGRLVTLTPTNQVLSEIATVTPKAGSNIYLTLDTAFQITVEKLLGKRNGAVVVMEPNNGTIYALASYPRFKPSVFSTSFDVESWVKRYSTPDRPLVHRATQGLYPPASIFKIVVITAALESLTFKPEDIFFCNGKWNRLGKDFEKKCWLSSGHGQINLVDGLTQSCDVVFYEVGLALHRKDPQLLPQWANKFGLGMATKILGVAESNGVIPTNEWKQTTVGQPYFEGDAVNSAIGQGYVLSTPLQIARLMAAICNGGRLIQPRLVNRVVNMEGKTAEFEPEMVSSLPILPKNLTLIQNSLAAVVSSERGTARQAFEGFSHTVAGKTGTAESGQEKPHAWFTGYMPVETPQVVITIILEHTGEGSAEAAPLFRQVAEAFFEWKPSLSSPN